MTPTPTPTLTPTLAPAPTLTLTNPNPNPNQAPSPQKLVGNLQWRIKDPVAATSFVTRYTVQVTRPPSRTLTLTPPPASSPAAPSR